MGATSDLRKKISDLITGHGTYTPPAALFLSLHSADPGIAGSHANEIVDAAYARQSLAGNLSEADATTGLSTNTAVINFGPATVQWNVRYLGIEPALTGGTMLIPGIPQLPKIIPVGGLFQLAPGQLRLRVA